MRALFQQATAPGSVVTRGRVVAVIVASMLFACNQDGAASNDERETHMGTIRAVAAPSEAPRAMAAPPSAAAPAVPSGAVPAAGSATVTAPAATAPPARTAAVPDAGSAPPVPRKKVTP
jgi:hypothetical protein